MRYLFTILFVILFMGCGDATNDNSRIIKVEGNVTSIPKDENTTIEDMSEGVNITVQGDYYVISGSGTVIVGDGNGNTLAGNSGQTTVNGDNNYTDTMVYELWYHTELYSCCFSCGDCDDNVTKPGDVNITSVHKCNRDFSGDAWCDKEKN